MCERVEKAPGAKAALAAAVAALDAVDPTELVDEELHDLVVALQAEESRFAAMRARVLAAWDARRLWADDGSKSATARLARECDASIMTARAELKRARKLRTMPATAAALAEGKLSVDKADLLALVNQPEVAHLFARDEQFLVEEIKPLRFPDAVRAAKYWLQIAEDEVAKLPSSCRHDGRYLTAVRGIFGTVDVRGTLDAIGGTEFLSELERLERQLFEADWANARAEHGDETRVEHLARTGPQRRADAAVLMAERSRSTPPGAQMPHPLITILAGYGAFSRICELADGTVVAPGEVVPLLGEADIERIVFDGPSRVIDVGVRRRFFRGALRRAIEVRDRHCTHPSGCDVPAEGCDIDHIVPRSEGGLTVQENGRCLCGFHNRQRVGERHERPPPDSQRE
jgi:hypothetical protein